MAFPSCEIAESPGRAHPAEGTHLPPAPTNASLEKEEPDKTFLTLFPFFLCRGMHMACVKILKRDQGTSPEHVSAEGVVASHIIPPPNTSCYSRTASHSADSPLSHLSTSHCHSSAHLCNENQPTRLWILSKRKGCSSSPEQVMWASSASPGVSTLRKLNFTKPLKKSS